MRFREKIFIFTLGPKEFESLPWMKTMTALDDFRSLKKQNNKCKYTSVGSGDMTRTAREGGFDTFCA